MPYHLLENQWELKVNQAFDSSNESWLLGIFNSPIVAVSASSIRANPVWRKGGYLSQSIILPDETIAFTAQEELELGKTQVLEFPTISNGSYELYYFPLERLEVIEIRVWEYQGQVINPLLPEIGDYLQSSVELNVDMSTILERLDSLVVACQDSAMHQHLEDINIKIDRILNLLAPNTPETAETAIQLKLLQYI